MIKDTDEQPDEMHRARSGRVLSAGTSVPVELGCISLQVREYVHRSGSFLDSVLWGFYGIFNINFILRPSPFSRYWSRVELKNPNF